MNLATDERRKFFARAADLYEVDGSFRIRFERDAPLYGVRWALIALNEFLPEGWQRRQAAGVADERSAVLERQLAKAADLLQRARSGAPA